MAQHNDGSFYRGEDVVITVTMSPVTNISGWTIAGQVKNLLTDPTALITLAGTVTNASAGIFTVPLTAAQTLSLAAGSYPYALERTDSGSSALISEGTLQVRGSAWNA